MCKILIITIYCSSFFFSKNLPKELKNQEDSIDSKNFLYNDIKTSKYYYTYGLEGKKLISKNYLSNGRLVSQTLYKVNNNENIFIFNK